MTHTSPFILFIVIAAGMTLLLLMMSRRRPPEDDRKVADLVHTALMCKQNGQIDEAEYMLRKAVATFEESKTPHFGMMTTSLINLAQCCSRSGNFDEATRLYQKLLALWKSALQRPDPTELRDIDYAAASSEFGASTNDVADLYAQVVAVKKKLFGPFHEETLNSMTVHSRLLQSVGRREEQEAIDAEIKKTREKLGQ